MGKIDVSMLGPCGIYCGSCDIYVACTTGDRETQKKIADWLTEHHDATVMPEDIKCGGCRGPLGEHWSADCKVLACAKGRGVATCAECGEHESCDTLETFYRSGDYESARATLRRIAEIGLEGWVKEKGDAD
jgi:hypothetical protein